MVQEIPAVDTAALNDGLEARDIELVDTGSGRVLVRCERFRVEAGDAVAVVGPSGAGKSLFLRVLAGFVPAGLRWLSGEVSTGGLVRTAAAPRDEAAGVVLVPQGALDALPPHITGHELLRVVLRARNARLDDHASALIAMHTDILDRFLGTLSGGQAVLVSVLAAVAVMPRFLLIDEPTSQLDLESQARLSGLLLELRRARIGLVLVTHDLRFAGAVCSHQARVEAGVVRPAQAWPPGDLDGLLPTRHERSMAHFAAEPRLTVRDVSLRDQAGRLRVEHVDLELRDGEAVALIGATGSGKTTIGHLAVGLLAPTSGAVQYHGGPLERQVVFQNPLTAFPPHLPIRRWIDSLGARARDGRRMAWTRASYWLSRLGLEQEMLDRPVSQLSGGQAQRIAIASVMAVAPRFLFLDEPTSMLDVETRRHAVDAFVALRDEARVSLLVAGHDLALLETLCDRAVLIRSGRVADEGPVALIVRTLLTSLGRPDAAGEPI
jgi:peptide/nickel transport system ATP-binding protein